jgi:hypothetical protein
LNLGGFLILERSDMVQRKKNGHGGRRAGAGRPKGSIERFTSRNLKHFDELYPVKPLDHMMTVINAPPGTPGVTYARRDESCEGCRARMSIRNFRRSN